MDGPTPVARVGREHEPSVEPIIRDHTHDENCGQFAYAVGYLTSGIDMFLAGGNDAQQLRRDRARVEECLRAAGRI
jgi:hypothetical protein